MLPRAKVLANLLREVKFQTNAGKPTKMNLNEKPILRRDRQKQAAQQKTTPFIPGIVNLQIIGAGRNGTPTSVYLFTDRERYLFNCGEGTQRLAHEHKTKLSRLEQIFVTRSTWKMIGGFPGLALTVQDVGVKELSIHGPPFLDKILQSMKRFVVLKAMQVKTVDCTQVNDFEDPTMSVKYIPLYRKGLQPSNDNAKAENIAIAYLCKMRPRPGALNLDKCVEQGVKPGPLLGLLKNGIDVTLDNGKIVRSKDVSNPGEAALCFLFLDVPDIEFLTTLEAESSTLTEADRRNIKLIIHFSPPEVLSHNRFKTFLNQFDTNTEHLYLNSEGNNFSGCVATHRIQYQLNQLHPGLFPLLEEALTAENDLCVNGNLKRIKLNGHEDENQEIENESKENHISNVNAMTNFHLRPSKGIERSLEAKLNPDEYIRETQVLPEFTEALAKLKEELQPLMQKTIEKTYPRIVFLGTGSCIPNKTRNVSAILVEPTKDSFLLFDCGEGTLGQIIRFYGKVKAEHVIKNLNVIYVSHLHADHHIGFIGLLKERQRLLATTEENTLEKKLLLFAPKQIQTWLNFYNEQIEGISEAYELIGNAEMLENPLKLSDAHSYIGVETIHTCLVRHCPHSFGVSITLPAKEKDQKPVKITYSGDTMPCQDLIELGRNSTILIHEATMEDDLVKEAKIKQHSTISQAIDQGRAMDAEHIILTHFSQRYAKLPRMHTNNNRQNFDSTETLNNVSIAFDNMEVTLEDLQHFHLLYPALKALFAEHAEELEQRAIKREMKLERKRKLLTMD